MPKNWSRNFFGRICRRASRTSRYRSLVVATDLYGREARIFSSGPLLPAIAASMAVPGLVRPVEIDGRVFVDGAAANPLPFDVLRGRADVVVAVDTATGPPSRAAFRTRGMRCSRPFS